MLNLDNPDPEIFAMIRRREEYMNASLVIPELFRIRLRSSFNKKINSYGLKNKVTEYLDKLNPTGYNYCDTDSLTIALLDMGYKARKESLGKRSENPNYIFNIKVI
jgi:hypothetical protein